MERDRLAHVERRTDGALGAANEARMLAVAALARLEAHEGQCVERWMQAVELIRGLKAGLAALHNRWWGAVCALLLVLLSALGYLLRLQLGA